jgi:hypothetical protein
MTTDGNNASEFLTVDEAARLAGRSHWTIRRWLEPGGKLTRYKSLNRTIVSRSELLELVQPKKEEPK